MITLHHLNNSRSQRILWILEELEIPYEIKFYQRDTITMLAPKELKQVHTLGKSPVITDDAGPDLITVAESGAIIEYLAQTYGKGMYPQSGTEEHRQYTYWMHYAEGSLMPQLLIKLIFDKVKTSPMPFFIKPIARMIADKVIASYAGPNIKTNLGFIEEHLSRNHWFCAEKLTGADVQMSFPLEAFVAKEGGSSYPNILAYVNRIQSRDAYKKALEVGGPYDYA